MYRSGHEFGVTVYVLSNMRLFIVAIFFMPTELSHTHYYTLFLCLILQTAIIFNADFYSDQANRYNGKHRTEQPDAHIFGYCNHRE